MYVGKMEAQQFFSPSSERWRGWGTHLLHVPRRRDSHRNRLLSLSIIPILGGFIPRGGSRKTRGVVFLRGMVEKGDEESLWPLPTDLELEALRKELQMLETIVDAGNVELRNMPQCLQGLTENWEARSWSREYWLHQFGHLKFRLRPCTSLHRYGYAGPAERLVSLEEYLSSTFNERFVLFENDFDAERLEVLGSFAVPECLAQVHGAPIFSVGRQNTGVGFHRHSAAWLCQLLGRKLWLLLPGDSERIQCIWPRCRADSTFFLHSVWAIMKSAAKFRLFFVFPFFMVIYKEVGVLSSTS